jgi:DNA-binding IscR family transcriptional regulator
MVRITKKTDYGLTLLGWLWPKNQTPISLCATSPPALIFPINSSARSRPALLEAGIITSKEGATGGYRLAKSAG